MRQQLKMAALGLIGLAMAACVTDAVEPPPPPKEAEVVHHWNFNALPTGQLTEALASASTVGTGRITYPGTGNGYMDRVDPGTDLNALSGIPAGFGLRPRNPSNTRELLIVAPSTGYEKLEISYALQRSSPAGAEQQLLQYSADGGTTWVNVAPAYDLTAIDPNWERKYFNLETVAAVSNNANLRFRILFQGPAAAGTSGNHRIDNLIIEGVPQ
ncbi:MAG: hypothetical protein KF785_06185 [Gemmatimonadales bacterium]|nr:hypothetical protein [Gemmatimonadales bacterium]